ncbi:MAG TPA: NAD-dependent deacylase [Anaerolineales bacterium]|nr:NAD-dependent deacylase [Anaerolineales bacterium]
MKPSPASVPEDIAFAGELLQRAERAVVVTGAGISTPSGIPDFRSEGTGLWAHDEPLEAASLNTFRTHPERFYAWFRPLASQIFTARPNAAHLALARLEQEHRLLCTMTQNIDLLHQKAGSAHIVELHGTLATLSCTQCFQRVDSTPYLQPFVDQGTTPRCPRCGAVLKPDVILFGEQLPQKAWLEAQRLSRQCDLMIVAGSSLEVLPVAGLPLQAIDRGAHLLIVNNTPTYLDVRADAVLRGDVVNIIPAMVEQALNG